MHTTAWEVNVKPGLIPTLVVAAVLAVSGGGWLLLPSLQDEQITVDAQASEQLERARRLLHQYSIGLTYKSLLLDQLHELGLDMDVMDADSWQEAGSDEYQRYLSDAWQRYQPMDWQAQPPRPARVQLANLEGQIKTATNQYERCCQSSFAIFVTVTYELANKSLNRSWLAVRFFKLVSFVYAF